MKILIIEDESPTLLAYKNIAKSVKEDNEIVFATNVDLAIQHIETHNPSIILLDILIPGTKDGFEILNYLNAKKRIDSVNVYVITNLPENENRERAMELGATDFFVKSNVSVDVIKGLITDSL